MRTVFLLGLLAGATAQAAEPARPSQDVVAAIGKALSAPVNETDIQALSRDPFALTEFLLQQARSTEQDRPGTEGDLRLYASGGQQALANLRVRATLTRGARAMALLAWDGGEALVKEGDTFSVIAQGMHKRIEVERIQGRNVRLIVGAKGEVLEFQ